MTVRARQALGRGAFKILELFFGQEHVSGVFQGIRNKSSPCSHQQVPPALLRVS